MTNSMIPSNALGVDDIILSHSARGLGISYAGAEGVLGGESYRVWFHALVPAKIIVPALFPRQINNELS